MTNGKWDILTPLHYYRYNKYNINYIIIIVTISAEEFCLMRFSAAISHSLTIPDT